MRDHAVTLHLSKSESTASRPTFSWLTSEHLHLPASSGVNLVSNHVVKLLIVNDANKDVCYEMAFLPRLGSKPVPSLGRQRSCMP